MAHGPTAMADDSFSLDDDQSDDLPRTFRREKEARAREAREREAQERAAAPSLPLGSERHFDGPSPQISADPDVQPYADEIAYPASVRRFDVPFAHLVTFFLKAVVAAVPAMILMLAILWCFGSLLEALFPELIKMKILISVPN